MHIISSSSRDPTHQFWKYEICLFIFSFISDILHEGEIIDIQGNNVQFLCEHNSLQIPIDDIKAFTLHSFDVRNPSNEDLSVLALNLE